MKILKKFEKQVSAMFAPKEVEETIVIKRSELESMLKTEVAPPGTRRRSLPMKMDESDRFDIEEKARRKIAVQQKKRQQIITKFVKQGSFVSRKTAEIQEEEERTASSSVESSEGDKQDQKQELSGFPDHQPVGALESKLEGKKLKRKRRKKKSADGTGSLASTEASISSKSYSSRSLIDLGDLADDILGVPNSRDLKISPPKKDLSLPSTDENNESGGSKGKEIEISLDVGVNGMDDSNLTTGSSACEELDINLSDLTMNTSDHGPSASSAPTTPAGKADRKKNLTKKISWAVSVEDEQKERSVAKRKPMPEAMKKQMAHRVHFCNQRKKDWEEFQKDYLQGRQEISIGARSDDWLNAERDMAQKYVVLEVDLFNTGTKNKIMVNQKKIKHVRQASF